MKWAIDSVKNEQHKEVTCFGMEGQTIAPYRFCI